MIDFRIYLRENSGWLTVNLFLALVMTATMLLNGIPAHEIGYGMLLCVFVTVAAAVLGFGRHCESLRQLEEMRKNIAVVQNEMKVPEYLYETYYQDCINVLVKEKDRIQNERISRQQDLTAYYSMWVHQIKTPIAALKLLIDEEISAFLELEEALQDDMRVIKCRQMQNELFRIEQYADMALQYTRLGAETNDFVFENVMLDEVIKSSVHKYARQFIQKQLRLSYTPWHTRTKNGWVLCWTSFCQTPSSTPDRAASRYGYAALESHAAVQLLSLMKKRRGTGIAMMQHKLSVMLMMKECGLL